jgi:hypothetical protein
MIYLLQLYIDIRMKASYISFHYDYDARGKTQKAAEEE